LSRKLLSFLGNGKYTIAKYNFEGNTIATRFVQEAIVRLICNDWDENDKIVIFLTKDAAQKNYKNSQYLDEEEHSEGLEAILEKMDLKPKVITVDIPDGNTDNEIWEIFRKVYDSIDENDEIYFDITHSFRYLPMLAITLLNYAKVLKDIKVNKILYGNYYTSEIMDITSFDKIMSWTNAIDKFLSGGDATDISKLSHQEYAPKLKESKGGDEFAKNLKNASMGLNNLMKYLQTSRGPLIDNYKYETTKNAIKNSLDSIEIGSSLEPMKPLLERVGNKLEEFKNNDKYNGLKAVGWCIDHNLIQQGYTILQESIITIVCKEMEWNELDKMYRDVVSSAFAIKHKKIKEEKWNEFARKYKELVYKVMDNIDGEIVKVYGELTQIRNDINHGGYRKNGLSPEKLEEKLKKLYNNTWKYFIN
jgi:CRISPR-associated Csx2 family protein